MTKVIETGGNGNCLFSSIGYFIGKDHEIVRKEIVAFMREKCRELLIGGAKLCCLIKSSEGMKKRRYFERMERLGELGGEIEIFAASKLYNLNIKVYDGELKLRYEYSPGSTEGARIISLRYSSSHYQAIEF